MLVIVYGTLKRGCPNNRRLTGAKFVSDCVVRGYKLYDCGFPVAQPDTTACITGEVWDISGDTKDQILWGLDSLEGVDHHDPEYGMYKRVPVVAYTDNGSLQGEMYVGTDNAWGKHIPSLKECPKDDANVYTWSR